MIPAQGDLVTLSFDPQAGREQKGRGPALVVSVTAFNRATGLAVCCPITNTCRKTPFHVELFQASSAGRDKPARAEEPAAHGREKQTARRRGSQQHQGGRNMQALSSLQLPGIAEFAVGHASVGGACFSTSALLTPRAGLAPRYPLDQVPGKTRPIPAG